MGADRYSTLAESGGLKLIDVIPMPGYFLGILTAWVIQIPTIPRTLFYAPLSTPFRPVTSRRYVATILFFAALDTAGLDIPISYFKGLIIGNFLLALLAIYKTRLQVAGILLQVLVPALLIALTIRISPLLDGKIGEDTGLKLLLFSLPAAGIFWALPYGKKLSWQGSWSFPYPRTTSPKSSQVVANPAVNLHTDSRQSVPQSRHHADKSRTRARARTLGPKGDTRQGPRYARHPGQAPYRGLVMWLAGWPCCLAALGLTFWGAHRVVPVSSASGFYVVLSMMGVSAFDQSRKLFLKGRRHIKPAIWSPNVLRPGSYVLYLRSFKDDKERTALQKQWGHEIGLPPNIMSGLIGLVASSRDEEEHIADALRPVGPLVAVGAPGEVLPFAGAARMYLPKDEWEQPVRELMMRSRLVTLVLGSSLGTMWELSEAMRILPPQRLLLFVPGRMREEEYEMIRKMNKKALLALPESKRNRTWKNDTPSLPDCASGLRFFDPVVGVIHFSADWEPTFTRTPNSGFPHGDSPGGIPLPWENLCTSLIRGLRPTFEQLVAHEEATGWHCG
ncbi:hypothetical protein [Streptomyces sp. NPDC047042]|uniref:hypothetical protein n=1 Tax=Streptomyces sp. NPDC047042 TaxID=3154807 RepID=UPI0033DD0464